MKYSPSVGVRPPEKLRMTPLALGRMWVERLARGRTFWRRLPRKFGRAPILVSPDARLQHLKWQAFDPELLRLAHKHVYEDSVVWDIGANIGVFSLAAGSRARSGYVLAVEPDPWLCGLLHQSASHRRNRALRLQTLCAAIADHPGTASLAIANRGRASNYLEQYDGRSQTGGVRESRRVPVLTLDLLAHDFPEPTLIKIDVEGAELAVLQGAHDLLAKARPRIAVEVGHDRHEPVSKLLLAWGYELFDQTTGAAWQFGSTDFSNILAIPK